MTTSISTQFITTTVIATTLAFPSDHPVPVAAIAGGIVGGTLIAALVTVGWIWWGKQIKQKQLQDRLETESRLQTLKNTRRNASTSPYQHASLHRPLRRHIIEQRIKFANSYETNEKYTRRKNMMATYSRSEPEGQKQTRLSRMRTGYDRLSLAKTKQASRAALGTSESEATITTVGNLNSVYTTVSEEECINQADGVVDSSEESGTTELLSQDNARKRSRQGTQIYELERQSISTYATALSEFDDNV